MSDSIFALSSGRPPAAIGVIRISGSKAYEAGRQLAGDLPPNRVASVRNLRDPATGEVLDQALVLRFDGPASVTGEDILELHCHGGRAVIDGVLAALTAIDGLRLAAPGEFTRRAFDAGRIDLTEAEGLADLLEAETESQRKAAMALAEGGLRRQIGEWNERLLQLSALAERAIDYDEDDGAIDPSLPAACRDLAAEMQEWLRRPRVERLKDGVLVVVAGPPNVGKSSLINAIVGEERAIVSDMAGTTRDQIDVPLALGGLPLRLTDTAGLRDSEDPVEAIGVDRARRLMKAADVLVWLGDAVDAPAHSQLLLVQPKADLGLPERTNRAAIAVSAVTGEGISALLEQLRQLATTILPGEGVIALNRRQAELVGFATETLTAAADAVDLVIVADLLRSARAVFDRLTGRSGVNELLDTLFSRFCLGK